MECFLLDVRWICCKIVTFFSVLELEPCWGKNWIVVVIEKSKFISLLNHDASTSLKNQHFLFHVDRNSFFLINIDVCKKYSTFSFYCLMKKSVFELIVNTRALKLQFNLWQISILKTRRWLIIIKITRSCLKHLYSGYIYISVIYLLLIYTIF